MSPIYYLIVWKLFRILAFDDVASTISCYLVEGWLAYFNSWKIPSVPLGYILEYFVLFLCIFLVFSVCACVRIENHAFTIYCPSSYIEIRAANLEIWWSSSAYAQHSRPKWKMLSSIFVEKKINSESALVPTPVCSRGWQWLASATGTQWIRGPLGFFQLYVMCVTITINYISKLLWLKIL